MSMRDNADDGHTGARVSALSAAEQQRVDGKVRQLPTLQGLLSEADPHAYSPEQLTQAMLFVRDMIALHPRTDEEVRRAQQRVQKQHRRVFKKSLLLTAYRQMLLCRESASPNGHMPDESHTSASLCDSRADNAHATDVDDSEDETEGACATAAAGVLRLDGVAQPQTAMDMEDLLTHRSSVSHARPASVSLLTPDVSGSSTTRLHTDARKEDSAHANGNTNTDHDAFVKEETDSALHARPTQRAHTRSRAKQHRPPSFPLPSPSLSTTTLSMAHNSSSLNPFTSNTKAALDTNERSTCTPDTPLCCEPCPALERFLVSKAPRSQSGVLVVTVFTSAYPNGQSFSCQWNCYYCPNEPGQPRSYLLNEPGVRRANKLDFDACRQFTERVQALRAIGHPTDKVEVLVLGGTWESYPADYRERFMRDVFYAANMITEEMDEMDNVEIREAEKEKEVADDVAVPATGDVTYVCPISADDMVPAAAAELVSSGSHSRVTHTDGAHEAHQSTSSAATATFITLPNSEMTPVRSSSTSPAAPAAAVQHRRRPPLDLLHEQLINETAYCRVIGVTLETRPDTITPAMLVDLRRMGCTRVQLGVQHTDDAILDYIHRQATREDTVRALKLLKDSCFKVDIHLMPDLPGTTPAADRAMFDDVLYSPELQADQWKIYPCQTTPFTVIERWYREGRYRPYGLSQLIDVLLHVKRRVPPWVRLNRVVRDIPVDYVLAGVEVTNLRQLLAHRMRADAATQPKEGVANNNTNNDDNNISSSGVAAAKASAVLSPYCRCIRCREVKGGDGAVGRMVAQAELKERRYTASEGEEVFLSMESADERVLFAFLRLRLHMRHAETPFPELTDCALIRELHVYGNLTTTHGGQTRRLQDRAQHRGLGGRLLQRAEVLAQEAGYGRVAVISGVGVRGYYAQKGYRMVDVHRGAFLIKTLGEADGTRVSARTTCRDAESGPDGQGDDGLGWTMLRWGWGSWGERVRGSLHRWWQCRTGKREREGDDGSTINIYK